MLGLIDGWLARLGIPGPRPVDRAIDVGLVLAVAVATSVPFIGAAPGKVTALGLLLNLATVIPLLWRRRAPFAVMVIVGAAATAVSVYHRPGQNLQYAGLLAIYTVASLGRKRWQRLGVLVAILVTFPPASLLLKHNDLDEFMFTLLLPLAAFLLGSLERTRREHAETLRERTEQLERERVAEAARAAAEERARVARDMHDILAHAVSLMVVQAEAGPVVVRRDPERAEQAFEAIADAGRDAMTQLRRLLGVLKADEPQRLPQPTLDELPELVGGTASLEVTGVRRQVPPDTEIAVYRIVQEALTNTVKHARAQHVTVRLDWSADELEVSVIDDGQGPLATVAGGHGLVGIRERAVACGGTAEAGPRPGGGFEVRARLPCPEGVR
ncbi:signal transduction histidine kinase [Kribbella orskensis]|uniref:histidine kinase n=1 Tax=Kribbella orskensis TaxID=2512216 RepID=A0ABY2BQC6_9ACTN|nr:MULTISPECIES: histidine kinase [Kribbella]TCN37275.1 signal transduction histidine kinase [Kribbella sp. VKM Ac-2500]TCO27817.1 signal transduction histidine kinase [Kribbella orskensis]